IEDFSGDFLKIDSPALSGNLASVLSSATVVNGNLVLDFGGGNTLTLNGITDVAALDGRIQGVSQHDPESDLTGDGTSDILWRNGTTGQYGMFDMSGGTPTWSVLGGESTAWQIGGLGDFDGDGTDDILWRNDTSGGIGFSAMGSGSPVWNALGTASAAWQIMGVGDFNGD
ncbi:FG-GAP-like repeat-containing protein, partial [Nioella sediminis]|uniref:FG-GAP-like repeat-containing protein n=1 Tax=Nioella sediminis TaxID=1912092 RepID=UPI000B1B98ED